MRAISLYAVGTLVVLLVAAGLSFGQATARRQQTLVVRGYAGEAPVVQINGKSYVQIESLARLTNGSISFQGNQITLTVAAPGANAQPGDAQADTQAKQTLSKDFLRAGIDVLTAMREWRVALVNAIRSSSVSEDLVAGYARDAETKLALVSAAISTDPDRDALPLFTFELTNMRQLSDKYLNLRKSMTYIPPDSLDNDALDKQVQNCGRGLASLASSGHPQDVPACH